MLSFLVKFICLSSLSSGNVMDHADPSGKVFRNIRQLNSFTRYFIQRSSKHQAMILTDSEDENESLKINNFVQKINFCVPTIMATVNRAENLSENYRQIGGNPRETTIFVIITFSSNANLIVNLQKTISILIDISQQYTKPKCMIVHFSKMGQTTDYKMLLKTLWKWQFLDVSVLQLRTEDLNSVRNGRLKQQSFAISKRFENQSLHQFNPFSQNYTTRNSWVSSSWFPDKGENLYNQKLYALDKTRSFRFYKFHKMMSVCLNYSIRFDENRYLTAYNLAKGKFQFLQHAIQYFHLPSATKLHRSRVIHLESLHVIVPKIQVTSVTNVLSYKLFLTIIANVLLVLALRVLFQLLKFDKDCWQTLQIGGIILGMGLERTPKSAKEKFALCYLLLVCMIYSGFLHLFLTEFELQQPTFREINSLEELAESNITLRTSVPTLLTKNDNKTDYIKKLQNRIQRHNSLNPKTCLRELIIHKNVSCSFTANIIRIEINYNQKKFQKKVEFSILNETLSYRGTVFVAEPGFPVMDNFNRKLLQFIEVGLMSKWTIYASKLEAILSDMLDNESQSTAFLLRILVLLIFGYILALITFFGEIIWNFFTCKRKLYDLQKRRKQKFVIFLLGRSKAVKRLKYRKLKYSKALTSRVPKREYKRRFILASQKSVKKTFLVSQCCSRFKILKISAKTIAVFATQLDLYAFDAKDPKFSQRIFR